MSPAQTKRGLQLSGAFYQREVYPILKRRFPNLRYAAALLGSGSEVLGFDDTMSTDHHWGPRVMLFLSRADRNHLSDAIHQALAIELPYAFEGYSTNFSPPDPNDNSVQTLQPIDQGPVNHRVAVQTLGEFCRNYLGFDPVQAPSATDWLTFPQQKLRSITAGAIFHDTIGLGELRAQFDYYPRDVWLYQLAAVWNRIGEAEHLMGRAGYVGDEIGSRLIGARLVRDLMQLAFFIERVYAPYAKWFGTAFRQLGCADELMPLLEGALQALTWQERETHLVAAYGALARRHNALKVTPPLQASTTRFFKRPFQVLHAQRFADALLAEIRDPEMLHLLRHGTIGGIDLITDNASLCEDVDRRVALQHLYVKGG